MPFGLAPVVERFAEGAPTVALAPPRGFRTAEGVRSAWPVGDGPFGRTPSRGGSAAQKLGRKYERLALAHLSKLLGDEFRPHQWFKFLSPSGELRWCQTDGLLISRDTATIFEVKYTLYPEVWWQLRKLYEPVIRRAFLPRHVELVVVCRKFDPAVVFPERLEQTSLLEGWQEALNGRIGVFQWSA